MMVIRNKLGIAAAVLLLVSFFPPTAYGDITRGCKGEFIITLVEGVNSRGGPVTGLGGTTIEEFEGRGACASRIKANDCRRRAQDNIFRCASDIWNDRWNLIGAPDDNRPDHVLPAICRGEVTGARKVGFKINQYGKATDIKYAMEYAACCQRWPKARSLSVALHVHSSGDKGCGGKPLGPLDDADASFRTLQESYGIDCRRLRQKGMCGVPEGRSVSGDRKDDE